MIEESEVREKLAAVVRDQLSLEDFERWLMPESWSMHNDSSPGAVDLVSSIHILLSERDDGLLHESTLRGEFSRLLDNVVRSVC